MCKFMGQKLHVFGVSGLGHKEVVALGKRLGAKLLTDFGGIASAVDFYLAEIGAVGLLKTFGDFLRYR